MTSWSQGEGDQGLISHKSCDDGGGGGGVKIAQNCVTSFMDDPIANFTTNCFEQK